MFTFKLPSIQFSLFHTTFFLDLPIQTKEFIQQTIYHI
jgi:hypothetical protein